MGFLGAGRSDGTEEEIMNMFRKTRNEIEKGIKCLE